MAKTAEEKRAYRKAYRERRREQIRKDFREAIDNHDKDMLTKAWYAVLDGEYMSKREGSKYYREYLERWAKIDIANNPILSEIVNNFKNN